MLLILVIFNRTLKAKLKRNLGIWISTFRHLFHFINLWLLQGKFKLYTWVIIRFCICESKAKRNKFLSSSNFFLFIVFEEAKSYFLVLYWFGSIDRLVNNWIILFFTSFILCWLLLDFFLFFNFISKWLFFLFLFLTSSAFFSETFFFLFFYFFNFLDYIFFL